MENSIRHIVLADDDRDHACLFGNIVSKNFPGLKTSFVHDGNSLLPFLSTYPVDLLFLDLNMPSKNGFECLHEIRAEGALKDLPVIVFSNSAHLSDIQKSFMNKADFYLVKPFRTTHLVKALEMILSVNWKEEVPIRQHYFINNRFVPFTMNTLK